MKLIIKWQDKKGVPGEYYGYIHNNHVFTITLADWCPNEPSVFILKINQPIQCGGCNGVHKLMSEASRHTSANNAKLAARILIQSMANKAQVQTTRRRKATS